MAQTAGFNPPNKVAVGFDCKMFDFADCVASIERENFSRGSPPHKTFSVVPQEELEILLFPGQPSSLVGDHVQLT